MEDTLHGGWEHMIGLRRIFVSGALALTLMTALVAGSGAVQAHGIHSTPQLQICKVTTNKVVNSAYYYDNITGTGVVDETVSLIGKYDSGNPNYYCGQVAGEYHVYCSDVTDCGTLNLAVEVDGVAVTSVSWSGPLNAYANYTFDSGWFTTSKPANQLARATYNKYISSHLS